MDLIEQDLNSMLSIGDERPAMRNRVNAQSARGIKGTLSSKGHHHPTPPVPSTTRAPKTQQQPSASVNIEIAEWEAFNARSRQVMTGLAHRSHGGMTSSAPAAASHQQLLAGGSRSTSLNGPNSSNEAYIRQFLEQNGGGRTNEHIVFPSARRPPSSSAMVRQPLTPLDPASSGLKCEFPPDISSRRNLLIEAGTPPPPRPRTTTASSSQNVVGNRLGTGVSSRNAALAWNTSVETAQNQIAVSFSRLTVDMIVYICGFCDPVTLVRFGMCNRKLFRTHQTPSLWRYLYFAYSVPPPPTNSLSLGSPSSDTLFDVDSLRPASVRQAVIEHIVDTHKALMADLSSASDRLRSVEQRLFFRHQQSARDTNAAVATPRVQPASTGPGAFSRNLAFSRERLLEESSVPNNGYTNGYVQTAEENHGALNGGISRQLSADIIILSRKVAELSNQMLQIRNVQQLAEQQRQQHNGNAASFSLSELLHCPSKAISLLNHFERLVVAHIVFGSKAQGSLPIAICRGTDSFQQLELALLTLSTSHAAPQAVAQAQSRWQLLQRGFPLAPFYNAKDELSQLLWQPESRNGSREERVSQDTRRLLALIGKLVAMPAKELVEYFRIS